MRIKGDVVPFFPEATRFKKKMRLTAEAEGRDLDDAFHEDFYSQEENRNAAAISMREIFDASGFDIVIDLLKSDEAKALRLLSILISQMSKETNIEFDKVGRFFGTAYRQELACYFESEKVGEATQAKVDLL